ncbi:hypothetical protein AB1K89_09045 [Sporosarcina sp. 179-K 8C2 HS]|uniref:hypothetical protein n=1 Tax=Sporosarcina sp. 179-K 8C2 HS TaxID=3142387 RepID=UPI0039A21820
MSALSLTIEQDHYLSDPNRNLYRIIHFLVKEGIQAGEFRNDLTDEAISMLITRCMRGTIYDWIIFGHRLDPVVEIRKFTSTVLDGLKV